MTNKEFEDLNKIYSAEELAESFVFPYNLSPEEQEKAVQEISLFIKKHRESQPFIVKLRTRFLSWKYRLEDFIKKL